MRSICSSPYSPLVGRRCIPTEMLLRHPALLISSFIQCEVDTLTHALYRALRDKPKTKFLNATVSRFVQELLGLRNSFL